ncbi:MAG: di-trans,poly-cis-decaprenylcistransferase [Rickettsiales bacterium]|jgi:undecaprenyl diphosphate synthase|nr:di-trans,poly-cis-decaprenylcistransferase [Rickettsiales bacterium]
MGEFPENIAIIMDGNGRWAQRRGLPIVAGHSKGAATLEKMVKYCANLRELKSLTVFAFSTENWKRPPDEVNHIMELFLDYTRRFLEKKEENGGVRVKFLGCAEKMSEKLLESMKLVEEKTKDNTGLRFDIALNYGGRREIVDACKKFARDAAENIISPAELTENNFKKYLYDGEIDYPDLIIRTGGDYRLSNFLLWELSYSELYFTDTLWPDFDENSLSDAIENYKQRRRTFGERRAKR